jgi:hypothetical protein
MENIEEVNIKELFDKGYIVPLRAIYEVTFNPVFRIKQNLGVIADHLKKHYNVTAIKKESSMSNEETVVLIRTKEHMTTYFTFSAFKVVQTTLKGTKFNFEHMVREVNNVPVRVKSYAKILQRDENYNLIRIGVRLQFLGSIDKIEKIKNLDKSLIFNQCLLDKIACKEDKLCTINFKLAPNQSEIKEGSEETIINISSQNVNIEINDEEYKFYNSVLIDCIRGFFYPGRIDPKYLFDTEEFVNNNILPIFKGDD